MGHIMIKPFKIIETRTEVDGAIGVIYEVSQSAINENKAITTKTMNGYISVPQGRNVDAYVFEQLSMAGWF